MFSCTHRSQLPYVSRPRISLQPFLCLAIKAFHVPFQLPVGGIQHELRQRYNVFGTLCQQWYMQRKLVQTVEQVFPEPSFGYRLFQILIGGGHQPDVRLHFFPAAYGSITLFLQRTQQRPLHLGIQITHFVQKQCPAVGGGKHACLVFRCSGKGTLHMAEQLRCRQFLRKHSAIYRYERRVCPSAQCVYLPGHILLSCS